MSIPLDVTPAKVQSNASAPMEAKIPNKGKRKIVTGIINRTKVRYQGIMITFQSYSNMIYLSWEELSQ